MTSDSIGKKVRIFFNNYKYEGILIDEDDIVYVVDDKIEGIIKVPKTNSVLKEIKEVKDE